MYTTKVIIADHPPLIRLCIMLLSTIVTKTQTYMHRKMQPSRGQQPKRHTIDECPGLYNAKEVAMAHARLKAIDNDQRQKLINIFLKEKAVSKDALAEKTGLADSLLVKHLKALLKAGLVSRYYQKDVLVYELDKHKLHKTACIVKDFLLRSKASGYE